MTEYNFEVTSARKKLKGEPKDLPKEAMPKLEIINVDEESEYGRRVFFNVKDDPCDWSMRLWSVSNAKDGIMVEYSIYKCLSEEKLKTVQDPAVKRHYQVKINKVKKEKEKQIHQFAESIVISHGTYWKEGLTKLEIADCLKEIRKEILETGKANLSATQKSLYDILRLNGLWFKEGDIPADW